VHLRRPLLRAHQNQERDADDQGPKRQGHGCQPRQERPPDGRAQPSHLCWGMGAVQQTPHRQSFQRHLRVVTGGPPPAYTAKRCSECGDSASKNREAKRSSNANPGDITPTLMQTQLSPSPPPGRLARGETRQLSRRRPSTVARCKVNHLVWWWREPHRAGDPQAPPAKPRPRRRGRGH